MSPSGGRTTVGVWLRTWRSGRADLSASTAARYDGIIRVHLLPRWGHLQIGSVRHSDVQAWTTELVAGGWLLRPFERPIACCRLLLISPWRIA